MGFRGQGQPNSCPTGCWLAAKQLPARPMTSRTPHADMWHLIPRHLAQAARGQTGLNGPRAASVTMRRQLAAHLTHAG